MTARRLKTPRRHWNLLKTSFWPSLVALKVVGVLTAVVTATAEEEEEMVVTMAMVVAMAVAAAQVEVVMEAAAVAD